MGKNILKLSDGSWISNIWKGLVSCHFCASSAEMKWKQIVGSTCFGHDNWSNRWLNNDMRYNEEAIHSAIVLSCTWLDFNHIWLKKQIHGHHYTCANMYTSSRGNALFIQESGILEVPPGGGRLIQVLEVNGGLGVWRWFGLWKQMKGWWLMIQATKLGGGNSYSFWFSPTENWGFMIQVDEHIFQMGWFKHQPARNKMNIHDVFQDFVFWEKTFIYFGNLERPLMLRTCWMMWRWIDVLVFHTWKCSTWRWKGTFFFCTAL